MTGLLHATGVTWGWNGHWIRVSTQSRLWRRKFPCHSCWDSNSQPFDHESGALTNKLSRLPHFVVHTQHLGHTSLWSHWHTHTICMHACTYACCACTHWHAHMRMHTHAHTNTPQDFIRLHRMPLIWQWIWCLGKPTRSSQRGSRCAGNVFSLRVLQPPRRISSYMIWCFLSFQGLQNPHDVAVDSQGHAVYVGELSPPAVWKFQRENTNTTTTRKMTPTTVKATTVQQSVTQVEGMHIWSYACMCV